MIGHLLFSQMLKQPKEPKQQKQQKLDFSYYRHYTWIKIENQLLCHQQRTIAIRTNDSKLYRFRSLYIHTYILTEQAVDLSVLPKLTTETIAKSTLRVPPCICREELLMRLGLKQMSTTTFALCVKNIYFFLPHSRHWRTWELLTRKQVGQYRYTKREKRCTTTYIQKERHLQHCLRVHQVKDKERRDVLRWQLLATLRQSTTLNRWDQENKNISFKEVKI